MNRLVSVLALVTLAAPAVVEAQSPAPPPDQVAAMAELPAWSGEWEGEGWTRIGEGEPRPFHVHESVTSRLGGTLVVLEGHGTTVLAEGEEPVTIYDALSLLYWDSEGYRLETHTALGRHGAADLELLEDGSMQWGFDSAEGEVRFVTTIDGDRWSEKGEISADGSTWTQFHSMELTRN